MAEVNDGDFGVQATEPGRDWAGEGKPGGVEGGEKGEIFKPVDGESGIHTTEPGSAEAVEIERDDTTGSVAADSSPP